MKKGHLVGILIATALTHIAVTVVSPTALAAEVSLAEAIAALPQAEEDRTGYQRTSFRHWIDEDGDGCNTRAEVLIAEASSPPAVDSDCRISGGAWYSYYDNVVATEASGLDIDHMVPLAEAWDSGASAWTAERRRAYANDLGDERSLVAVTARSNRSKSDQDPAEWIPPHAEAICRYITEWVTVKTRWALTINTAEYQALTSYATSCPNQTVTVTPA